MESYRFYCVYLYEVAPNKCVSWATFCKLQFTLPFKYQVKKPCSLYYFLSVMKWKKTNKEVWSIIIASRVTDRMNQEISNMFHIVSTLSDRVQTFLCKYANMAKKWQQCRVNGSSCKKSPQPSYIALFLSIYHLFEQRCKKSPSTLILSSFFLSIVFSNKDETFLFLRVIWIFLHKK